jgi:glycosyltransferase involved in cell wall biosynthesis
VLSAPGDPQALAAGILQVIDDAPLRMRLGGGARRRAEERWDRRRILASFERQLCELAR